MCVYIYLMYIHIIINNNNNRIDIGRRKMSPKWACISFIFLIYLFFNKVSMYIKTADFAVSSTLHYIVLIINVPSYTCGSEKKKKSFYYCSKFPQEIPEKKKSFPKIIFTCTVGCLSMSNCQLMLIWNFFLETFPLFGLILVNLKFFQFYFFRKKNSLFLH